MIKYYLSCVVGGLRHFGSVKSVNRVQSTWKIRFKHLYLSESSSGKWSTVRIVPGGRLGPKMKSGTLPEGLHVQIAFVVGNETFMFGQNHNTGIFYIFKFNLSGEISEQTYKGKWHQYKIVDAYYLENTPYLYAARPGRWFISELSGNNFVDLETATGSGSTNEKIQFTFMENNTPHLFIRNLKGSWYVKKLSADGKLSTKKETSGHLPEMISKLFPLSLSGKQYIYVYDNSKKQRSIRELKGFNIWSCKDFQKHFVDIFYS